MGCAGIGFADSDPATPQGGAYYTHGDQIGTLRAVSAGAGLVSSRLVFTAFGEQVFADGTVGTRYQYAGEYGYETAVGADAQFAGIPFLHVGYRWYDPATGRFLQRDPIGLWGDFHSYDYVAGDPIARVDALGLQAAPHPNMFTSPCERTEAWFRAQSKHIGGIPPSCGPWGPAMPPPTPLPQRPTWWERHSAEIRDTLVGLANALSEAERDKQQGKAMTDYFNGGGPPP